MPEQTSGVTGSCARTTAPEGTGPALRLAGTNSITTLEAGSASVSLLREACAIEASLRREARELAERSQRPDVMKATTGISSLERAADEAAQLVQQIDAILSAAAGRPASRARPTTGSRS